MDSCLDDLMALYHSAINSQWDSASPDCDQLAFQVSCGPRMPDTGDVSSLERQQHLPDAAGGPVIENNETRHGHLADGGGGPSTSSSQVRATVSIIPNSMTQDNVITYPSRKMSVDACSDNTARQVDTSFPVATDHCSQPYAFPSTSLFDPYGEHSSHSSHSAYSFSTQPHSTPKPESSEREEPTDLSVPKGNNNVAEYDDSDDDDDDDADDSDDDLPQSSIQDYPGSPVRYPTYTHLSDVSNDSVDDVSEKSATAKQTTASYPKATPGKPYENASYPDAQSGMPFANGFVPPIPNPDFLFKTASYPKATPGKPYENASYPDARSGMPFANGFVPPIPNPDFLFKKHPFLTNEIPRTVTLKDLVECYFQFTNKPMPKDIMSSILSMCLKEGTPDIKMRSLLPFLEQMKENIPYIKTGQAVIRELDDFGNVIQPDTQQQENVNGRREQYRATRAPRNGNHHRNTNEKIEVIDLTGDDDEAGADGALQEPQQPVELPPPPEEQHFRQRATVQPHSEEMQPLELQAMYSLPDKPPPLGAEAFVPAAQQLLTPAQEFVRPMTLIPFPGLPSELPSTSQDHPMESHIVPETPELLPTSLPEQSSPMQLESTPGTSQSLVALSSCQSPMQEDAAPCRKRSREPWDNNSLIRFVARNAFTLPRNVWIQRKEGQPRRSMRLAKKKPVKTYYLRERLSSKSASDKRNG